MVKTWVFSGKPEFFQNAQKKSLPKHNYWQKTGRNFFFLNEGSNAIRESWKSCSVASIAMFAGTVPTENGTGRITSYSLRPAHDPKALFRQKFSIHHKLIIVMVTSLRIIFFSEFFFFILFWTSKGTDDLHVPLGHYQKVSKLPRLHS